VRYEILYGPEFGTARIMLDSGESVQAEAGAMTGMSASVEIQTQAKGGLLGGLKRSVLGGESFFLNTFTASAPGEVLLSTMLPGDMMHRDMAGETIFVQSGSYIASSPAIQVDTKWGGAKTFFGGEGLFLLRISGAGDLFVTSYGAIRELQLAPGEQFKLDTGHVVAFEESVQYEVNKVGGWKSTLLSGEGLVVTFTGPGKLWMQTHSPHDLISWIIPQIPSSGS
jgi:uncharacterized protein (TIGR00266 family)